MLDKLMSFLGSLGESDRDGMSSDDPRVAAAALMIHVIEADGVQGDAERTRLREALASAYGVGGHELETLVSAGEEAERDAVDLFAFTSVLNRALDEQAKVEFIGILWEMVYADGESHELEDNMVWRIAELIGVAPRDRVLMRQRVRNGQDDGSD